VIQKNTEKMAQGKLTKTVSSQRKKTFTHAEEEKIPVEHKYPPLLLLSSLPPHSPECFHIPSQL